MKQQVAELLPPLRVLGGKAGDTEDEESSDSTDEVKEWFNFALSSEML